MDEDFIVSFLQRATWRVKTFILSLLQVATWRVRILSCPCCKRPLEGWGLVLSLLQVATWKMRTLSCPCCKWPLEGWGLYPVLVASGHMNNTLFLLQAATWKVGTFILSLLHLATWRVRTFILSLLQVATWRVRTSSCPCCQWPLEGWGLYPVLVASGHLKDEDLIASLLLPVNSCCLYLV